MRFQDSILWTDQCVISMSSKPCGRRNCSRSVCAVWLTGEQHARVFNTWSKELYQIAACKFCAGVIAVAVFGLYGSATSKFDISARLQESGAFEDFWDTFAFAANGIVFFFAGASSMNFIIRCLLLGMQGGTATAADSTGFTLLEQHSCIEIQDTFLFCLLAWFCTCIDRQAA